MAWIAILLFGIGVGIQSMARDTTVYLVGACSCGIGWAFAVPLVGQIFRNRLNARTFMVATTVVFVLGQAVESLGLMTTEILDRTIDQRTLNQMTFILHLPVVVLAWMYIKPSVASRSGSVRSTILIAGRVLRSPVLWISGIASSLFLPTLYDFGYVWDLNFQMALGWDPDRSIVLNFVFLIGTITGGSGATLVARWIGGYATMLTGMTYGCITFGMILLFTPDRKDIWFVVPLLFTMGVGFGSCSMILPYFARFFDKRSSGMFFAVADTIDAILIGLLVSVPVWVEATISPWTEIAGIDAMFPYL